MRNPLGVKGLTATSSKTMSPFNSNIIENYVPAVKGLITIVGMKCINFIHVAKSVSSLPPVSWQHYYFLMLMKLCETTELCHTDYDYVKLLECLHTK